ncbi:MAG: hypothetical protein Q9204_004664, partial [Flavoplaca sp. TL-2023a]
MAGLSPGQRTQKNLIENITLLYAICEVPNLPKENELHESHDERRRLSLNREKQLVDDLAFISKATDDMYRVTGVCIEEDSDGNGMTVRLASNTGDLSHVTQGFNEIARTLEQASVRAKSRHGFRQDLFRTIVTLDEPRILSRLRSKHAARTRKTSGKPELLRLLNTTIHDKSLTSRDRLTKARILRLQASALQLWKDFCNFEISRGSGDAAGTSCDILLALLIRISEFDVASLQIVLRSSTVDPSIKYSLPVAISKIGRYYNITCDLIDASRSAQCILFSRISIHAIDKPHVDTSFIADHSAGFEETFRRVTCSSQQLRHSNFDPNSVSAAKAEFQRLLAGSGAEWKVHAEIQIILFYDQNPSLRPPRIIGSSKSACYLCNLFVHHHESFQVARSHGRLYDRWILPKEVFDQDSSMRPVIDKLNASLENEILDVLKTKRKPFPHPAESA